ncbi:MAG: glycosyltransferase, partial [Candidatus Hydrogenedens sp.]
MKEKITDYLNKRAILAPWKLEVSNYDEVEQVVVIPAYHEFHNIRNLLHSLSRNDCSVCKKTLIIIVVNNRNETITPPEHIENNQNTLQILRNYMGEKVFPFPIGIIDASSPGYEFSAEYGVGLARKIGLDWGLYSLFQQGKTEGGLIWLDADCEVSPNYLNEWNCFFGSNHYSAGIMYSEHPIENTLSGQCMLAYEIFLRSYELGLHYANSPYTFLPIGSTIGVSIPLYVNCGGMNTRIAGEDFYFLQKIARVGEIKRLTKAIVYPSARLSDRVPFGTGAKLKQYINQPETKYLTYPFECFDILKKWLQCIDNPEANPEFMLLQAEKIHPELAHFLVTNYWLQKTKKIFQQNHNKKSLQFHLHEWFDGLKTLKLLHHLRDFAFKPANLFHTIEKLLQQMH